VFFAYDEGWNIYWCSALASRHSQNIHNKTGGWRSPFLIQVWQRGRQRRVLFWNRISDRRFASGKGFQTTGSFALASNLKLQLLIISIARESRIYQFSAQKLGLAVSAWQLAIIN
jgi:hypothetical protein